MPKIVASHATLTATFIIKQALSKCSNLNDSKCLNVFHVICGFFLPLPACRPVEYIYILLRSAPEPTKKQARILYKSN